MNALVGVFDLGTGDLKAAAPDSCVNILVNWSAADLEHLRMSLDEVDRINGSKPQTVIVPDMKGGSCAVEVVNHPPGTSFP